MTGLLIDTMTERADALDAPTLDPLTIVAAGQRRVTRRRTTLAASGAAVALAGAVLIPHLGRAQSADDEVSDVAAAFADHEPSYAVDSTVHIDGRTFDVGHRVRALVQTDSGVVFTDSGGDVFAADGVDVRAVGHTDPSRFGQRLVTDGSHVGWLDTAAERFVVLDQATLDRETLPAQPVEDSAFTTRPLALDDDVVYAVDARGLFAWDLGSGDVVISDTAQPADSFFDVKNGVAITRWNKGGTPGDLSSSEVRFGDRVLPLVRVLSGQNMVLSPDGSRAAAELDPDSIVIDTDAVTAATLTAPGYEFVVGYRWRDNESFYALGLETVGGDYRAMPISILQCFAATAACAPTVRDAATYEHLALPIGVPFED